MFKSEKKITLELVKENEKNVNNTYISHVMSNPINNTDRISSMVTNILDSEIPRLKRNPILHDLILYGVIEKLNTVQTVENVLSYIKRNNVKKIHDISFKNGEVLIKCST